MLANTTRALTEAQREQWAVDGYLQLEGALSPAEVVAQVMQHTADRTGDAEPPEACSAAVWYAR